MMVSESEWEKIIKLRRNAITIRDVIDRGAEEVKMAGELLEEDFEWVYEFVEGRASLYDLRRTLENVVSVCDRTIKELEKLKAMVIAFHNEEVLKSVLEGGEGK